MTFSDILGQDRAVGHLRRLLAVEKLPHALLFSGPTGVGKRATALALAQALNCTANSLGCGACLACEKIAGGLHPDVHRLRPSGAGNMLAVDDVRELGAILAFAPHEGRTRVVILEDADRMTPAAANAILKTLEEPPTRTGFVVCTAAPDQLLVTIRSRCQAVRFAPLSDDAVATILTRRGMPAGDEAVRLAGGSVTRALELAGEAEAGRRERLRVATAAAEAPGMKPALDAAAEIASAKEEILPMLELLARHYRDEAARADDPRSAARHARRARLVVDTHIAIVGFASAQLALEHMMLALRGDPA